MKTTALDLPLPEPLPDDVRELFDKCVAKLGLIPNVLLAYAHRPEKLRAFGQMYNDLMLGESGLSKLEREMIAVAVSAQNRCWYCQVAHGALNISAKCRVTRREYAQHRRARKSVPHVFSPHRKLPGQGYAAAQHCPGGPRGTTSPRRGR